MKKKVMVGICVLALVILLTPMKERLKDGGTVVYRAVLYRVEDVHSLNPDIHSDQVYVEGIIINILGIEVFNNVK